MRLYVVTVSILLQCCDGTCPSCEQPCGRTLGCRNHKCASRCHPGRSTMLRQWNKMVNSLYPSKNNYERETEVLLVVSLIIW